MLFTFTLNTLSHPFSSGKSWKGPPHVMPELLTSTWSLFSRFLNSAMRALHPALDYWMHLSGSRDPEEWNGRGKTHADIGDDVLCLGSSGKLVDIINSLAYERKEFEGRRKGWSRRRERGSSFVRNCPNKRKRFSYFFELVLLSRSNVNFCAVLCESARHHLSDTRATARDENLR